ncbi:MAG: hypothetical protein LBJ91_04870 [Clostridiales Family XIII bacterium]|nr:hypothetical protein [Clostridiales Family XIII bacterium]
MKEFDFNGFADDLLKDMGFSAPEPEPELPKPAPPEPKPQPKPAPPQPKPEPKPAPPQPKPAPPQPKPELAPPAPTRKKRVRIFPATRGDHIKFIIIVVAILLFEMIFIGFLSSKGLLDTGIFN